MGTFSSARRHVTDSFATTQTAMMKKRAASFMVTSPCSSAEASDFDTKLYPSRSKSSISQTAFVAQVQASRTAPYLGRAVSA
jgi:hypothetical protein